MPATSHSMFSRFGQRSLKLASADRIGFNFVSHGRQLDFTGAFRRSGLRFSSNATAQDNYKILGIDRSASAQDIKKAYRKLALQYHPDMVLDSNEKEAATERFKCIGRAYTALSNDGKDQLRSVERQRQGEQECSEPQRKNGWASYITFMVQKILKRMSKIIGESKIIIYWRIRKLQRQIEFHTKEEESLKKYRKWWGWLHCFSGTESFKNDERDHRKKIEEYTRDLEQLRKLQ